MLPLKQGETIGRRLLKLAARREQLTAKREQLADDLRDTTVRLFETNGEIEHWQELTKENPK